MASGIKIKPKKEEIVYIPLKKIFSPKIKAREWISPERVKEIAISASAHGIFQPILLTPLGNGNYELVYGRHRIAAIEYIKKHNLDITYSGYLPLDAIKAEIKELTPSERLEIALLENEAREDQNPIDKTMGILNLIMLELECDEVYARACVQDLMFKARGIAKGVNMNRVAKASASVLFNKHGEAKISETEAEATYAILQRFNLTVTSFYNHYLPLLNCCPDVIEAVRKGKIEYPKAGVINQVRDDNYRKALIEGTHQRRFSREVLVKMKKLEPQKGFELLARIEKENLTNKQIEALAESYLPKKEINLVKNEYTKAIAMLKKNNDIWNDRKKLKKLEAIVEQIKELAAS